MAPMFQQINACILLRSSVASVSIPFWFQKLFKFASSFSIAFNIYKHNNLLLGTSIYIPLIHFALPPRLLIDFKNSKWLTFFCILYIMHLVNSPDWFTFCLSHDYLSSINSLVFSFIFGFSLTKGNCSKRYTILSVLAVHRPFYISIYIHFDLP